eukprot:CAMPEP_0119550158 /NCGR_PEP_ID=MMETSP1352-20130426/3726_1 /TAXON_ID=265584 /ORGANISM="Stauroneis constricta, Strain CCMP1120" /LENGTH=200 /DNA_ID=CAMNT_0007595915 /DNA_START=77 /DNA_END=679 /DNA_ORIENTATION=+
MEESKLLALHDALCRHGKGRKGLGTNSGAYSWTQNKAGAAAAGQSEQATRADGLPNNALYSNFVRSGAFDPDAKRDDGDGRPIKRDFTDIAAEVSTSSDDDDAKEKKRKEQKEKKKAAKKAAKLEAKRQAKLEEKREAKRKARLESKKVVGEAEKPSEEPQQSKEKAKKDKKKKKKRDSKDDDDDGNDKKSAKKRKRSKK